MPGDAGAYRVTETLLASERQLVYRGVRRADGLPVLLKVLGPRHALPRDVERLEHEQRIAEQLAGAGAVRPLALERFQGLPALVSEDPGGHPLSALIGQPLPVGRFLRLAVPMAAALSKIHGRGVIHKDLQPGSFLVDEAAGRVFILDFRLASLLPREHHAARNPTQIEGTLAYISPEQTGRMNRALDHRSDLYSLGVTFYEALTGRLPFSARDPLEWVHCHVARQPQAPGESLPGTLVQLLMKLLAKEADQRYQSASGLARDLERCLAQWESTGRIDPFPLGELEGPDRLVVSQRPYGRRREREALLAAFDRVAGAGRTEMVMVSGAAGAGKSFLVHELTRPVAEARGFFLAGKFAQHQDEVPYATVVQAFRELILNLLTESDEKIACWRERLLQALHGNGRLIADLIPELGLIIGPQPPLEPLRPRDAQHRFEVVLRNFIAAFAAPAHPVVLFLDDLQWADRASLGLFQQLAIAPEVRFLLLVGAWRNNEVDGSHPLSETRAQLASSATPMLDLQLEALAEQDLRAMVADTLGGDDPAADELGAVVFDRTGGNPLFAVQLLGTLSQEGLIKRDPGTGRWRWQLDEIAARPTTGNVVDFLVEKVRRLPAPLQELLKSAACLGNLQQIEILSALCGRLIQEVQSLLVDLTREGLVARVADVYRFAHDRVLQAAYSLIPESDRPLVHLQVGRLLLARTPQLHRAEVVFDIVGQLNRGAALIDDPDDALVLAELNLTAGLKAKAANAHQAAVHYLGIGMELLRRSLRLPHQAETDEAAVWRSFYPLAYALQLARAECELLNHQMDLALQRSMVVIEQAHTPREKVPAYLLQRDAYIVQGKLAESLRAERACLQLFGIDLPTRPTETDVEASLARVRDLLAGRPIEAVVDLPLTADRDLQAALMMTSSASFTNHTLYLLHAAKMVALSLEHGNAEGSVFWYGCYGFALAGVGQYKDGHRFARAAHDLREKQAFPSSQGQSLFFLGLTSFWAEPLPQSRAQMHRALQIWRSTAGPLTGVALATFNDVYGAFVAGEPLDRVEQQAQAAVEALQPMGFRDLEDMCRLLAQLTRALQGRTAALGQLNDRVFDEAAFAEGLPRRHFARLACWYWVARMRLAFTAGEIGQAREAGEKARALAWSVAGNLPSAELTLFHALTLAAAFEEGSSAEREAWLTTLTGYEQRLRALSEDNPASFRHQHALVAAEMARISGRYQEAAERYQESVQHAAAGGFVQHEALAYELSARLREAQGVQAMADLYRMEARVRYLRWGANAKVKQMDERYPHLAAASDSAIPIPLLIHPEQIDLLSVARASQAISREVVPEKLLHTLMNVLLTQSGATGAALLVPREGSLAVQAVARVQAQGIEVHIGPAASEGDRAALPESVLRFTWRTGEVVVLDDAGAEQRFADDDYIRRHKPRSLLCLPIVKQGERVALLYLENGAAGGAFTPTRLSALGLLAGQLAISLENSLLFGKLTVEIEERKRAEGTVRFLLEAGDTLAESLDYQATLTRLAELAVTALADWCVVDVLEESGEIRRVAAAHRDPAKQATLRLLRERLAGRGSPLLYAAEVLAKSAPLIFPDMSRALGDYGYDDESMRTILELGSRSAMVLPLRARGRPLGSMALVSALSYPASGPPALDLAQELARRAAVAIDNARLYREAQEAIRMRDEFLSIASHELNTPLSTLRLLVEGLENVDLTSTPELLSSTMRMLSRQTRRLVGLVAELLNVTRLNAGPLHLELEAIDLGGVVKDVVERFSQELSRARCSVSVRAVEPVVGRWDRSRLEQVLTNLLSNAIKFGAGRPIQISVSATAAGMARLVVADQGIGIAPEQLPKIFGRFSRAVSPTHYGGLGLGLYIVSEIVRALGGSVRVKSRVGSGSTFTVELPLDSSTVTDQPADPRGEEKMLT